MYWSLNKATIVTPNKVIKSGSVVIKNKKISEVFATASKTETEINVDLDGLIVLPGLINCHDHLLGTYFPRVGNRKPYLNWLMWDNDLKSSPWYAERQQIESSDLYSLGAYRHLISGVTSVQDHIPHFVRELFAKDIPIHLIDQYTLAHSVGSFALPWGDGIYEEHKKASEKNIPFITHCSEGFDTETLNSVQVLEKHEALSQQTVLVHGLGFSDDDFEKLAKNNVHVVWCPVSNLYMFNTTLRVKKALESGINVVLGTDSPMSGSINIFEEMYIAKKYYEETYQEELKDKKLVEMLTTNAALAMKLPDKGQVKEEYIADLLIIKPNSEDPYSSIVNMQFDDIMLIILDGKPRYADPIFVDLFKSFNLKYDYIRVASSPKIIHGDVIDLLKRIYKNVNYRKDFPFLPIEPIQN